MTKDQAKELHSKCEVCNQEPASELQGGKYRERHKIWFVCKGCKSLIKDKRKSIEEIREQLNIKEANE